METKRVGIGDSKLQLILEMIREDDKQRQKQVIIILS